MVSNKRLTALIMACMIGFFALTPLVTALAATAWTKNDGKYTTSSGAVIDGVVARGIDVSHWKQTIDWSKVAADDIQFVMIGTRYDGTVDPYFGVNAMGAHGAGLKVGAYIYSYATTTEMASQEADFIINLIKDYPISYPVAFDVEASVMSSLSPDQLSDIINTFCRKIEDAGYWPMLYANDYWLSSKINMNKIKYDVWVARYETKHTYSNSAMWQATNTGTVAGIDGNVDINFAYKDFTSRIPSNTWRNIGGHWYYYKDYMRQTGWVNDGHAWYYFNSDGTQYKGWLQSSDGYYFMSESTGAMTAGWRTIDGKWYYFKDNGLMATEWVQDDGKWYYLLTDGTMVTGWLNIGDQYYYLKDDGSMITGWHRMDHSWYYFNEDGKLVRGWADISGNTYYMAGDGRMASGWTQLDNAWYYFDENGAMKKGWTHVGENWYYTDNTGKMLTGWLQLDGNYYYLNTDGRMLTGWLSDGTSNYYMSASGRMASGWRQIDGSWYYFDTSGRMVTGWLTLTTGTYYLNPADGKMYSSGSFTIDGTSYTFNSDGVVQDSSAKSNDQPGSTNSYSAPIAGNVTPINNGASGVTAPQGASAPNTAAAPGAGGVPRNVTPNVNVSSGTVTPSMNNSSNPLPEFMAGTASTSFNTGNNDGYAASNGPG